MVCSGECVQKKSKTTSTVLSGDCGELQVLDGAQQLDVTDLHEEDAGARGGVVVHVDRREDGCCYDDHHRDDAHQKTNLQPLITVSCGLLASCCTVTKLRDLNRIF